MENASKALIIAGAILISILLISVGIMVMNSINKPLSQSQDQADSQAIEMFNSKFTGYAGQQSAAAVKSLMTSVASSNGVNVDHKISVKSNKLGASGDSASAAADAGKVQAGVNSQTTYTVTFGYGSDGYINSVDVE